MKFLVRDSQDDRHIQIRAYLTKEAALIAVLLAAIDLEWTIRRVFDVAAGGDSSKAPKENISSLKVYRKELDKLFKRHNKPNLVSVCPDWNDLERRGNYQIRHEVVHGRLGSVGLESARRQVDLILNASVAIANAADGWAYPFGRRVKKRFATGPDKSKHQHLQV